MPCELNAKNQKPIPFTFYKMLPYWIVWKTTSHMSKTFYISITLFF